MDRMVPRSAAAAISDVLGCAHHLSHHAICVDRRAYRLSILTQPGRRSFLSGRKSFLLFEYRMVVFRPAHPTVLRIPAVVPDASETWSGPFPDHNRTRDFDFPLSPALRIPGQRRLRARSVLCVQAFRVYLGYGDRLSTATRSRRS